MQAAAQRLEFAPPSPPGMLRALGLALLAHALLLAALTWGVRWQHADDTTAVEAELWARVPQQAAPKPLPVPISVAPAPVATPAPPEPPAPAPQIVQEQIKKPPPKPQPAPPPKPEPKPEPKPKAPAKPLPDPKLLAQEKKAEQAKADAERAAILKQMQAMAGATGNSTATGTAQRAQGPSGSYAARVNGAIKPNIVFTDEIVGNAGAEVEVRTAPDGTIIARRLVQSSGTKAWDDAVLKAIDKTQVLPRDIDGSVPASLIITFRPKDK